MESNRHRVIYEMGIFKFGLPCCMTFSFLTLRLKLCLLMMEGMLKGRLFLAIPSSAFLSMFQSPNLIHLRLLQSLKDKSIMLIKPGYNSVLGVYYTGNTFVCRSSWQILYPLFFNYHYTKVSACIDYSIFAVGVLITIFNEIKQDFRVTTVLRTAQWKILLYRAGLQCFVMYVWSASQGSESHVMLWVIFLGWLVFFSSKGPRQRHVAAKELACDMPFTSLRGMPCTMNCCSLSCKMSGAVYRTILCIICECGCLEKAERGEMGTGFGQLSSIFMS